jgi:hypothetical protein
VIFDLKQFTIYYRFKGSEFREMPFNTVMLTDVNKKNVCEQFIRMIANSGMEAKVIRIATC